MLITMPASITLEDVLSRHTLPPGLPPAGESTLATAVVCHRSPCPLVILPHDGQLEAVIGGRYQPVSPQTVLAVPQGALVALRPQERQTTRIRWMAVYDGYLEGETRLIQPQGQHLLHVWTYLTSSPVLDAGLETLVNSLLAIGLQQSSPRGENP